MMSAENFLSLDHAKYLDKLALVELEELHQHEAFKWKNI